MAHPRRVVKVAKQIEREIGNLLIFDNVRDGPAPWLPNPQPHHTQSHTHTHTQHLLLVLALQVLQAAVCPERKRGFDGALSALASVTEVQLTNDLQVGRRGGNALSIQHAQ
jgi:hypothetical protein